MTAGVRFQMNIYGQRAAHTKNSSQNKITTRTNSQIKRNKLREPQTKRIPKHTHTLNKRMNGRAATKGTQTAAEHQRNGVKICCECFKRPRNRNRCWCLRVMELVCMCVVMQNQQVRFRFFFFLVWFANSSSFYLSLLLLCSFWVFFYFVGKFFISFSEYFFLFLFFFWIGRNFVIVFLRPLLKKNVRSFFLPL